MKKFLIFAVTLSLSSWSLAQNFQYKVISNTPPLTPRFSLNSDLVHVDMMQRTLDGYSINAGIWGHFEPVKEKIGIQYLFRRSYLAFGGLGNENFPANTEIELGGYYALRSTLQSQSTKIVLNREYKGSEYERNMSGDWVEKRTEIVTTTRIPADRKKLTLVRGGLYFKQHGNTTEYIEDFTGPDIVRFTSVGLYAGISFRNITSIFIDTKDFGVQFNSGGRDIYFDLLILPVNNFTDVETDENANDVIKAEVSSLPIGLRAGYRIFQVDKKAKTGKLLGVCGNIEAGFKPFIGITLTAGVGFTFGK